MFLNSYCFCENSINVKEIISKVYQPICSVTKATALCSQPVPVAQLFRARSVVNQVQDGADRLNDVLFEALIIYRSSEPPAEPDFFRVINDLLLAVKIFNHFFTALSMQKNHLLLLVFEV